MTSSHERILVTDAVDGRLSEDAVPHPGSHHGVHKLANEGTARIYDLAGSLVSIDAFIEALDRVVPGAAELVTHQDPPLPFPADIESTSLVELGEIPVTPLEDAIVASVDLFRKRLDDGTLDPAEHGLPA